MNAPQPPADYATVVCDTMNGNLRNPRASRVTSPTYYPLVAKVTGTVTFEDGTETGFTIYPESESNWHQTGTDPDHTFGDQLTKFAEAIMEYQRENTPSHHFHVGSNIPGYLPEGDVSCHVEIDDACAALKQRLDCAFDAAPDCINPVDSAENDSGRCGDPQCVGCGMGGDIEQHVEKIEADVEAADPSSDDFGVFYDVNDGRPLPIRFWLTRVKASDCEIDGQA